MSLSDSPLHHAQCSSFQPPTWQLACDDKWLSTSSLFIVPLFFDRRFSSSSASSTMSRPTGGGANDITRFLTSGAGPGPGSPNSNSNSPIVISASSQADWAAKRLVWVPSEKHGFEVSRWFRTFWHLRQTSTISELNWSERG